MHFRRLLFTTAAMMLTASLALAQPPYVTQWGSHGSAPGQFDLPWGIAVNPSTGEVYVADQNNNRVQVFDPNGAFLRQFGTQGSAPGQFDLPYGIAVDAAGDVYVTEMGNNRVQKLTSTGAPISMFGSLGSGNGQFNTPSGILVHSSGDIYVSDGLNHRIQHFSSAGAYLGKWGSFGSGSGQFRVPMGLAEDSNGAIYVADQGNGRVQRFSPGGSFQMQFGTRGSAIDQFAFPQDIAIDSQDHIYVTDMANYRVKQYDTLGALVVTWGSMGSGDGQFNWPLGIDVDANGDVYVSELDNSRVQRFGAGGCSGNCPPAALAPVQAYVDIVPGTYPNIIQPTSNAPVAVALLGGVNFNVNRIRTASITLNGRKPYLMAIGDVGTSLQQTDQCHMTDLGADGFDDVIFKFRTDDILTALPSWQEGETRMLTVSGTLDDGTPFAATDCVALRYQRADLSQTSISLDFSVAPRDPSRAGARIQYTVPEPARVSFTVYDVGGRRLSTLLDEWSPQGGHVLDWDSGALPSGVYFIRMDAGEKTVVRRIALQR